MYRSKFATDVENMLTTWRNSGLQLGFIDYFLADFDKFCIESFPNASLLTKDIAEKWIHNTTSKSQCHMARRVCTMKYIGKYQLSIGKSAYIPNYSISCGKAEQPRLFNDEQLTEFFENADTQIKPTKTFPYNDIIYPVMFRLIYCCGLRSSEACNLKIEDVNLVQGTISIYRSKGFKDRQLHMSNDIWDLCLRFNDYYSKVIPARAYFFQPSPIREFLNSGLVVRAFDSALLKTSFGNAPGKKFTPHGLRHLFAVQNIRKCAEQGEDFMNWIHYLCRYMGHKHINHTMYYLHITSQLFPVYNEKLKQLEERIGVTYVEEQP
jgi:integrase